MNESIKWIEYSKSTTVKQIKDSLTHQDLGVENPQDMKSIADSVMILYKLVNLEDDYNLANNIEPGDKIDL